MSSKKTNPPIHPRLETQIHRRKKAKALSPLLPEWEPAKAAPSHLRMDAAMMTSKPANSTKN